MVELAVDSDGALVDSDGTLVGSNGPGVVSTGAGVEVDCAAGAFARSVGACVGVATAEVLTGCGSTT